MLQRLLGAAAVEEAVAAALRRRADAAEAAVELGSHKH